MADVVIVGAGGHAKVILDIIRLNGDRAVGLLDDNPKLWGQRQSGVPILGALDSYSSYTYDYLILAMGSNALRHKLSTTVFRAVLDENWLTAVHPSAVIASDVKIGCGTVVMAGAIVNSETVVGRHGILNTASSVDHDNIIGDYVHIAPGAHLAGGIRVNEGAFVGIGASVVPNILIDTWSIVGAGAVVIRDVESRQVVIGNPAKPIKGDTI